MQISLNILCYYVIKASHEIDIETINNLQKKATRNSKKHADRMVRRSIQKNPPASYKSGDNIFVKVKQADHRLRRGGKNLTSPKAREATVLEEDEHHSRYKVMFTDEMVEAWVPVEDITASTKAQQKTKENAAKQKGMFILPLEKCCLGKW